MKKLFLSASFKDVAHQFPEFASDDLVGKTVTFIPTAALNEKVDFYVKSGQKALEKMGLIVDILELSTASPSEISSKLQNTDYIYVSGGNTFFLLQILRKAGADHIMTEAILSGIPYIGESAGSIILSPNIAYVKGMDDYKVAPELNDFDGLNMIDFYPVPHYNCFPFKKTAEKIIAQYSDTLPIKPITNTQVILVHGDAIKI